jgi:hypothetical protein
MMTKEQFLNRLNFDNWVLFMQNRNIDRVPDQIEPYYHQNIQVQQMVKPGDSILRHLNEIAVLSKPKFNQISHSFTDISEDGWDAGKVATHWSAVDMKPGSIYMLVFEEDEDSFRDETIMIFGVRSNISYGEDKRQDISNFKGNKISLWQTECKSGSTIFTTPRLLEKNVVGKFMDKGYLFWTGWFSYKNLHVYELEDMIISLNYPH